MSLHHTSTPPLSPTFALSKLSKVVFSPAFIKNTSSISINWETSPFAYRWNPKISSKTFNSELVPSKFWYTVWSSSNDKFGEITKFWNSLDNSGRASPSVSTTSAKFNSNTLQLSAPLKAKTKLDKSNVPSPTLRILNPIPSYLSISMLPVAIL